MSDYDRTYQRHEETIAFVHQAQAGKDASSLSPGMRRALDRTDAYFSAYAQAHPDDMQNKFNLAAVRSEKGDFNSAIALFGEVAGKAAGELALGAEFNLASSYAEIGQYARSREILTGLLPRMPENAAPLHTALGQIDQAEGLLDDARRHYELAGDEPRAKAALRQLNGPQP